MVRSWTAGVLRKHVKAHSQAHTAWKDWECSHAMTMSPGRGC